MTEQTLQGKTVAMVISFRDFRDVEYFIPRETLERAGAKVVTISNQKGLAVGADGGEVKVDLTAEEAKIDDFEAILFIGGPGMVKKLDDSTFQKLALEAGSKNKIVGAICIAPALLAKAGILQRKKATVWSSLLDKSAIKMLEEGGAIYQEQAVVVDGNIITANGPAAAKEFAQAVIALINKEYIDNK